ncbi:RES family NAD+ phosphorylase [Beijerinckia indica]|uniref:RES domain protein n=1 Tax=Beijerinckia indica subsp. indica (strain ATCC 9039 / DSM 1715 / NCIMB 8712) TaxID=395963 RepID=B2IKP2_BEII9|nr:RES domain-containing protein [Beijerinckia indica]ACB95081.1 RES domain protein [Beijerinckia indica subsp. indica ATCC 9039]
MRWRGTGYRAHDPKWAWAPISGDGAALKGGRFNPVGVPALYLALTIEGMFLEMGHGFSHRFDPLTICSYDVDIDDLIDLRTEEGRAAETIQLADMACAWAYDLACEKRPASWDISEALIAKQAAGILTPSFATGARLDMANLVLWRWGSTLPHKVIVHDPSGRLPKDQSSWPNPKPDEFTK